MKTIISSEQYGGLHMALHRAQVHHKLMMDAVDECYRVIPNLGKAPFLAAASGDYSAGFLLRCLHIEVAPTPEEAA